MVALELQEAHGTLRDMTADPAGVIAKLDLGEIEIRFTRTQPNILRDKLRHYIGKQIGLLWFDDPEGNQVVRIRESAVAFPRSGGCTLTFDLEHVGSRQKVWLNELRDALQVTDDRIVTSSFGEYFQ